MAEFTRPRSEEYWRPARAAGNALQRPDFQTQGNGAFCASCGAPYAVEAFFCHQCGAAREGEPHAQKRNLARNPMKSWFDLEAVQTQFGLSAGSLTCLLAAIIFALAAVMTGLVYNTSTLAEWQAVQCWRIEWLLAALAALVAAMLFRTKP